MNLFPKEKQTDMENRLMVAKGEGRGGMDGGLGGCKQLHVEWISNEVLLCSTGTYNQSLGVGHDGGQYEKEVSMSTHVCMTGSLCHTEEIDHTIELQH